MSDKIGHAIIWVESRKGEIEMTEKVTFRLPEEMTKEFEKVYEYMRQEGIELDNSKLIRFLITKGLEKLRLESKIK